MPMKARRRRAWPYLLLLLIVISILAWPAYVTASTALAWMGGNAWQLDAWTQIPKRVLLQYFLDGYRQSLVVGLAAGLLVVLDYLLMSRLRITWWFSGILLPLAGAALAILLLPSVPGALPTLVATGLLLAVAYRLFDLLTAIMFRRSRY